MERKFKVWNTETEKMENAYENKYAINQSGEVFKLYYPAEYHTMSLTKQGVLIILKSTNILAVNEMEIYQGDIIEYNTAGGKRRKIISSCNDLDSDFMMNISNIKILGNKFQNPELLK